MSEESHAGIGPISDGLGYVIIDDAVSPAMWGRPGPAAYVRLYARVHTYASVSEQCVYS